MAAGGYKEFVAGETLDQDEINDFLMQGMLVFAGTAARGSAITSPVEGQFSFLTDTDAVEFYDGSAWVELSTETPAAIVSATTGAPGTATSGGFDYYAFTGDGSITFSDAGAADILIVGAGGAGDATGTDVTGGGGGAGGITYLENYVVAAGTVTVTVGVGDPVNNGNPSLFGTISAPGGGLGGAGARIQQGTGHAGGSGGGGTSDNNRSGGIASSFYGNVGGAGQESGGRGSAGGGGGAGAVGADAPNTDTGGAGGAGLDTWSTWATATSTGDSGYFAGGGGGGCALNVNTSSGGIGGGGDGKGGNNIGDNGLANTGGGAGGSESGTGGTGGSGIVMVRVAV